MNAIALRRRLARPTLAVPRVAADAAFLLALLGISLFLRTRILDAGYWIDEGLSVGIASHAFLDIPGVLRQDGSPPLYYLLLHVWMELFGSSEEATHALSIVFALASIPAAWWAATSVFGRRAGLVCASFAAINPFLTNYAQETRMYTLVALLSILATGAFLHAFVLADRRYLAVFAALYVVLLYTHNWALFLGFGFLLAFVLAARMNPARWRDGLIVAGAVALAYLPWVPTVLFQAEHTGAPWSTPPSPSGVLGLLGTLLNGQASAIALLLAGGAGLVRLIEAPSSPERPAVLATIAVAAGTLASAWIASQFAPAWANRYFTVVLGPLLLLAAAGLPHARRLGWFTLALVLVMWASYTASDRKSNVREIVQLLAPVVRPGDLVYVTHPEQVPVLHHYLPEGLRYATQLGPVRDPRVMDWRDALEKLEPLTPATSVAPVLDRLRPGQGFLLVTPEIDEDDDRGWRAPWTAAVRRTTFEWQEYVAARRDLLRIASATSTESSFKGVEATLYRKAGAADE